MSVLPEPDGHTVEQRVIVWNGRIEELEGEPARTLIETSPATTPPALPLRSDP
jgi:hypothetical protein